MAAVNIFAHRRRFFTAAPAINTADTFTHVRVCLCVSTNRTRQRQKLILARARARPFLSPTWSLEATLQPFRVTFDVNLLA